MSVGIDSQTAGHERDFRKSWKILNPFSWFSLLTPADLSLVLQMPVISDELPLFCACFPTSLGKIPSDQGLLKPQAECLR